jgi:EPS-associated MarR family transcriptional regulator
MINPCGSYVIQLFLIHKSLLRKISNLMTKNQIITEDQLDLMHIIEKDGKVSQRLISQNSGFSIGKVNYCLKALIDIGFIKIHNFNNSNKKLNYAYILTPKGIQEKTAITKQFIIKKKQEYDKLNSYINT